MTLAWADGFEHYGDSVARMLDGVYADVNQCSISTANPSTGSRHLRVAASQNNSGPRRVLIGGAVDTLGSGYRFYIPSLPSTSDDFGLFQIKDSDNENLVTVTVDTTGRVQARHGDKDGTILGSSAVVIAAQAYQHVEMAMYADESHGTVEVRVNGITVLNLSGVDTLPAGLGLPAQIRAGCDGFAKTGAPSYVDIEDYQAWIGDATAPNDFIGDKKAYTEMPDSDGAENDWGRSTGVDAWPLVDNIPPDDSGEYIFAVGNQTSNERQTLGISEFPAEIVAVTAVYLATRAWKTDAGDARITVGAISGASEDQGSEHALSTQPIWYGDVFTTDPATASPWTLSGLNSMLTSLERTL